MSRHTAMLRTRRLALAVVAEERVGHSAALVLAAPRGVGKTVALCVALAQRLEAGPAAVWVPDDEAAAAADAADPDAAARAARRNLQADEGAVRRAAALFEAALAAAVEGGVLEDFRDVAVSAVATWQTTKRKWLALAPGDSVPYPRLAILCYSVCTALLHSLFLARVLKDGIVPLPSAPRRVVALCAGSGAEAVAFALRAAHTGAAPPHIDIVDVLPRWNLLTRHLVAKNQETGRPTGTYHTLDLLGAHAADRLRDLVREADLVTLVYGLTELFDRDRMATRRCLEAVVAALRPDAALVIVDPRKTCHGKDAWLAAIPAVRACRSVFEGDVKYTMQAQHVEASPLGPWISKFGLALNDDVKLSMHVWLRVYQTTASSADPGPDLSLKPLQGLPLGCYVTYTAAQQENVVRWLHRIDSDLRVFTLAVADASASESDQNSALWHLASALESTPGGWNGVVVLTIAQVRVLAAGRALHADRLCMALRSAQLTVLDDADWYLNFRKNADWTRAREALSRILCRVQCVIVCEADRRLLRRANELFPGRSYVVKTLSVLRDDASLEARITAHFGCALDLCDLCGPDDACSSSSSSCCCCCKGLLRPESAVTVFTAKPPPSSSTPGAATLALKALQLDPAPLGPGTRDVVLHFSQALPRARLDALAALAAFRLASAARGAPGEALRVRVHLHSGVRAVRKNVDAVDAAAVDAAAVDDRHVQRVDTASKRRRKAV